MSPLSDKLLRNLSAIEPKVKIERASADPVNGFAKVVFSTNLTKSRAVEFVKNTAQLEKAFNEALGEVAHVIPETAHHADEDGNYFVFVKANTPRVTLEDAQKEGSGYHLVAANVFADDSDNIWDVKEDASGNRIIVRNGIEDLTELLTQVAPPENMSVAASAVTMQTKLDYGSLATFLDPETSSFHNGIVLDTAHAYDFEDKKIKKIGGALFIAGSDAMAGIRMELNSRMGPTATVPELASANIQDVITYLDTLYQNNPIFLAAYKDAVLRLIKL